MASSGSAMGKSQPAKMTRRERWLRQPPSPPPKGIQLLPSVKFEFDADQRKLLAALLPKAPHDLTEFFRQTESDVSWYLSAKKRRDGASSPAVLRDKLLKLRGQACSFLEALAEITNAPARYAPDSEVLSTLLNVSNRDVARRLDTELRGFVAAVDAACTQSQEDIEAQLSELQHKGISSPTIAQLMSLSMTARYRKRIEAHVGGQWKPIERELVRRLALSYQRLFGDDLTSSRNSPFYEFIHAVFQYANPDAYINAEEHRRIVEEVIAALRDTTSTPNGT